MEPEQSEEDFYEQFETPPPKTNAELAEFLLVAPKWMLRTPPPHWAIGTREAQAHAILDQASHTLREFLGFASKHPKSPALDHAILVASEIDDQISEFVEQAEIYVEHLVPKPGNPFTAVQHANDPSMVDAWRQLDSAWDYADKAVPRLREVALRLKNDPDPTPGEPKFNAPLPELSQQDLAVLRAIKRLPKPSQKAIAIELKLANGVNNYCSYLKKIGAIQATPQGGSFLTPYGEFLLSKFGSHENSQE